MHEPLAEQSIERPALLTEGERPQVGGRVWRASLLSIVAVLGAPCAWAEVPQSHGCGVTAPASGTYTILHGGMSRTYRVSMPRGYDSARPTRLVLVFHGWGGDESEFLSDATVLAEANRRGYIVVAPRGIGSGPPDQKNNAWTFRGSATGVIVDAVTRVPICDASMTPDYTYPSCRNRRALNSCSWTQCQDDDVEFVRALLEHLEATLCIDTRHVFGRRWLKRRHVHMGTRREPEDGGTISRDRAHHRPPTSGRPAPTWC